MFAIDLNLSKYNCKLRYSVECCPYSFSVKDCVGIVMDLHLTTLNGCRYLKKLAKNCVPFLFLKCKNPEVKHKKTRLVRKKNIE